ncbi:MAG: ABC transporter substrate-binding protein, partial [Gaiellaceae bacterium]
MARALAVAALALGVALGGVAGAATPRSGGTVVAILFPETPFPPQTVFTATLPGAFVITPDGGWREDVVTRAVVTRRPFTVTYHIRPEARWSDGRALTSRDFLFTYRLNTKQLPPEAAVRKYYEAAGIRRIRLLGPKAVRVVFRRPFAPWRWLFHWVYPEHAVAGEDISEFSRRLVVARTGRPIGSGPYLLSRWDAGRQFVLTRNQRYWGPRPRLDRIVVRFADPQRDSEDKAARLRSGEADVVFFGNQDAGGLSARRYAITRSVAPSNEHLDFGFGPRSHGALRRREVRQAIAYGIDRVALARELAGPGAEPLDNSQLWANSRYYEPNWRTYRHDPVRARRLLGEAGCTPGAAGIYECDGRPLRLRLFTTAGNALRERAVRLIQAQLRQIGIDVVPEFGPLLPVLRAGDFDLILFAWVSIHPDDQAADIYQCQGANNFKHWCSRKVAALVSEAQLIVDEEVRARKLNEADRLIARAVPTLPLFQPRWAVAHERALQGVV